MPAPPPLLLLGGSGLGSWAWQRVVPLLEESGRRVIAPTLSGTGDDRTPAAEVDLDTWARDVLRALDAAGAPRAVLVAHSFAGYLAARLRERHPERVASIVFVDANIPGPGVPWLTAMGPEVESMLLASVVDGAVPFFAPEQFEAVHPASGLDADDRALLLRSARPQPLRTETQGAVDRPLEPGDAGLGYIRCTRTTPPAAVLGGWTRVTEIDTGHWPMLSEPESLARTILELAQDPTTPA